MKNNYFIKKFTFAFIMVFTLVSCKKEPEFENTNANIHGKWQVYEVIDEDDVQVYKNTTSEEQEYVNCPGLSHKYIWSVEELLLNINADNSFSLYEWTKSSLQGVTSDCKLDPWEVQNHTIDNKGSFTFTNTLTNGSKLKLIIGSEYTHLEVLSLSENELEVYVKESVEDDQILALGELGIIGYKMKFRKKP